MAKPLALVTGASRGLGRLIAIQLARAGADLVLGARRVGSLDETLQAVQECRADVEIRTVACDLAKPGAAAAAATALGGRAVDILVNNAAIQGPIGPAWEADIADFAETIQVNYLSAVELCQACLPAMLARGAGWIVNMSGGGATSARPQFAAYAAAKTALVRFSETLAKEIAQRGIRVNAIAPGAFASRMTRDVLAAGDRAGEAERKVAVEVDAAGNETNAVRAAELVAYLTLGAGRDVTGRLIAAVWDPWPRLHRDWERLAPTDIYTLRRIVPSDRGWTEDPA